MGRCRPRSSGNGGPSCWRNGVSVSMAAKAYRLLRAVLMTAVEDDKILPRNPCRIKGAGDETPRRAAGPDRGPGLRAGRADRPAAGRQHPQAAPAATGSGSPARRHADLTRGFATRAEAERALWKMAGDGRADCTHDRRFRALVLLATFASLRWGEATALRRCDLDLKARTVRVRAAYVERSTGQLAARAAEVQGGPPRRRHPGRDRPRPASSTWPCSSRPTRMRWSSPASRAGRSGAATSTSCPGGRTRCGRSACRGLHVHDLRHTGNQVRRQQRRRAARPHGADGPRQRAGRADLPARGARRGQADHRRHRRSRPGRARQRPTDDDGSDGACAGSALANGTLMARQRHESHGTHKGPSVRIRRRIWAL